MPAPRLSPARSVCFALIIRTLPGRVARTGIHLMPFSASRGGPLENLTDGRTITAAEATRQFGRVQEEVASGPITLTHHGRARVVMLSPEEYARLSDAEAALNGAQPDARADASLGLPAIALDEMQEGYCEVDRENRFLRINRVAEYHFGLVRTDLVGRYLAQALPELVGSGLADMLHAARTEGRPQRRIWRSWLHEGRRVDLKMFPIPGSDGVVGVMFADIGEAYELKRRLAIAEARLKMMQEVMPRAVAVAYDGAGVTLEWPPAAEALLGWSAEEILGQPIETVLVQSDRDEEGGEEQLAVYVNWPLKVPEDKLPLAAELVAKANFGVLVGCIDLDFDDGEVRAKTGIDVFNLTNEVCESMFQNSMNITMMYLPALQLMLAEDLTPDEALEQVEG